METVTEKTVKSAYQRYARYYDFVFGPILRQGRKTAIQNLNCRPGQRILEVGVGTGLSFEHYPKDVKVVGIDLSTPMLQKARIRAQKNSIVEDLLEMDAQAMTFPTNSFDKVVAMHVASVVPDVAKMYSEIQRVCKPGGEIIFLNHFNGENGVLRRFEKAIQPLAHLVGFHSDFPLKHFLEKTKFKVLQAIPVNAFEYWTVLVGRNDKA